MQHALRGQVLALAGVLQAAALVDRLAKSGSVPDDAYKTSIASLFEFNPSSAQSVYGGDAEYRFGLDFGMRTLKEILSKRHSAQKADVIRYALSLLHLAGKLRKAKSLVDLLGRRLRELQGQLNESGPTGDQVILGIARAYQETLSTFRFRIQVQGDGRFLQNKEIADQVRALLLAGVRAATLWHQLGGRRWHLLFYRRNMLHALEKIA
ncbi:MAG: high frequency lysogenization protein HflD [Acidobacteriales bacterium]|nr:high frequency lysogenization protein HflD [Terriglobales bacterium]